MPLLDVGTSTQKRGIVATPMRIRTTTSLFSLKNNFRLHSERLLSQLRFSELRQLWTSTSYSKISAKQHPKISTPPTSFPLSIPTNPTLAGPTPMAYCSETAKYGFPTQEIFTCASSEISTITFSQDISDFTRPFSLSDGSSHGQTYGLSSKSIAKLVLIVIIQRQLGTDHTVC